MEIKPHGEVLFKYTNINTPFRRKLHDNREFLTLIWKIITGRKAKTKILKMFNVCNVVIGCICKCCRIRGVKISSFH